MDPRLVWDALAGYCRNMSELEAPSTEKVGRGGGAGGPFSVATKLSKNSEAEEQTQRLSCLEMAEVLGHFHGMQCVSPL